MIKLCRVDHRLVHGQVAFSWTKYLSVDCILIASDNLVKDTLKMNLMKMAKPSDVKLVMKNIKDSAEAINSGVTEKYKLMILCESVDDAFQLINKTDKIETLNLGGMKHREDRKSISKAVNLSKDDISKIKELIVNGCTVEVQMVPDEQKINVENLI